MVNYNNGKIYKLFCTLPDVDEFYVGGTCTSLYQRLKAHVGSARGNVAAKVYVFMREHGIQNFQIELLEKCPCNTRKELNVREQNWVDTLQPTLNSQSANRHPDADKIYNDKPENKARCRAWAVTNKEKRSEQNRKLYEAWTPEHRNEVNARVRTQRADPKNSEKRKERNRKQRERQAGWSEEYKEARKARKRERYAKKKLLLSKQ